MAENGERIEVDFRTEPARYRHWRLRVDGRVATLAMDVREHGGLKPCLLYTSDAADEL